MVKNNVTLAKSLEFSNQKRIKISGFSFAQTSKSYPEAYDVFDNVGNQVGHVRLRWGCVSCWTPNVNGKKIYEAFFESEYVGEFDSDQMRQIFIVDIANTLTQKSNKSRCVEHLQIECIKPYSKYGITFAYKGSRWDILGKVEEDNTWIIKGRDDAIQIIEDRKFREHFGVEIIIDESAITICA